MLSVILASAAFVTRDKGGWHTGISGMGEGVTGGYRWYLKGTKYSRLYIKFTVSSHFTSKAIWHAISVDSFHDLLIYEMSPSSWGICANVLS